ncbi:hypothetical protein ABTC99_20995, partial [Acinetobacter baumannii]
ERSAPVPAPSENGGTRRQGEVPAAPVPAAPEKSGRHGADVPAAPAPAAPEKPPRANGNGDAVTVPHHYPTPEEIIKRDG